MTDVLKNVTMWSDLVDQDPDGYDYSDSFLDDDLSEADDGTISLFPLKNAAENLPPTRYEGFYINFGDIEFVSEEGESQESGGAEIEKTTVEDEIQTALDELAKAASKFTTPVA
jgi:hypothetical protein